MEDVHSVDVSWLHHSTRDHHHRQFAPSSPGLAKDARPRTSSHGGLPHNDGTHSERKSPESAASAVQQPPAPSPAPSTPTPAQKIPPKRPTLLGRSSSEKTPGSVTPPDPKTNSRKNSWISSISSKFSSQNSPAATTQVQAQGSSASSNGANGAVSTANGALNGIQAAANGNHNGYEPYVPQQPKGSFISNALRRLSSGPQVAGVSGKTIPNGGVCPRKVMNVDPYRNRCLVQELDQNKLRRVAFCVDVEIAGGPRYKDEEDCEERKQKRKEKKLKERGEGEALKHPEVVAEEKEKQGAITVCSAQEVVGTDQTPNPEGTVLEGEKQEPSKKKEKKKRSEAERKERKEKKRRKAEENGSIPLELTRDDDDELSAEGAADSPSKPPPKHQDRPTTDPLRIYRRCCQLRETPILKRISDQLSNPAAAALAAPGTVSCLDLTGSRLQLADVVTLSDWLAVVPVKKLFLEDADLNDEKIRVILAGLLAAKVPEPGRRRKSTSGEADEKIERSGVVKKLVLKNNPKITREGWKHIALFVYMCKSLMALDVSMVPFPAPAPASSHQQASQVCNGPPGATDDKKVAPKDIADILSKAISERLGGSKLEEFLLSECGLTSTSIRKLVDGCIVSGVQRLGLAGNDIDEEGLGHIVHFIKSGVCQGLDLGGNSLRDFMPRLAECFTKDCPLWALSVADCDLTPESLRILFPALGNLPNFMFLDLSHNRDLFSNQLSLCLLRKYMPQFKKLKRIHLTDVSLSQADVIGIAEVIPECPAIAHVDIQGNPQISALAAATTEEEQEEAAAVYASLTLAAKVSQTIVFLGVDVPAPESNEVVKALAKQVIAYCLRNMQNIEGVPELQNTPKDAVLPDVLQHLVGHEDNASITEADDEAAPDEAYIVGGTGVAKALNYCLRQKESDLRRTSVTVTPGASTPMSTRPGESEETQRTKIMSKNLLENARNIQQRLQLALAREAKAGNDIPYPFLTAAGRLMLLDQTLQGMIKRFEDEYPETRIQPSDAASTTSSSSPPLSAVPTLTTSTADAVLHDSDEDEPKALRSRHNSDVNLASRAQTLEEGRLHRLGHRIRTEYINPSRPSSSHTEQANMTGSMHDHGLPPHIMALRNHFATYSGDEIRNMTEGAGWEQAFNRFVENAEELKKLEKENPEEFAKFRDTQIAALKNASPAVEFSEHKWEKEHENAIED
ncbi:RNI-like protein [Bimuria novae-zelandiae CBS 107.79]|uniref:RNI-like protein n=1 Tax=Bimuria novae-zelandiae CBS 107.79 TaxID=1447943 RepID=A0A6A5UML6_9PLEO|nr:RNI-like protein [Bimuria novae-zelandiae CBS 107.79]